MLNREEFVVQLHSKHKKREKTLMCARAKVPLSWQEKETFASFGVGIGTMGKKIN